MELTACLDLISEMLAAREHPGVVALSDEETEAVLDLTRVVAHGVERKAAPLVAFAVGRALAGQDEAARLAHLGELTAALTAATGEPDRP